MNQFQPRYDEEKGIYRDCKWCHGKGCLACPGEAEKAYKEAFPDGPVPIATFPNTPEGLEQCAEFLKTVIPADRLPPSLAAAIKRGLSDDGGAQGVCEQGTLL